MDRTSRRRFAKLATAAAALPLASPLFDSVAQAAAQAPAVAPERATSPFAVALAAVVSSQYGQHLSPEQMTQIQKDFVDSAPYIERFRKTPLMNSDEPDITFSAIPEAQRCTK